MIGAGEGRRSVKRQPGPLERVQQAAVHRCSPNGVTGLIGLAALRPRALLVEGAQAPEDDAADGKVAQKAPCRI